MSKIKRVDAFDITYADSFARRELKVQETVVHVDGRAAKKGQGEKRIYVGSDERYCDDFFVLDKDPKFFIQKSDLLKYFNDAKEELRCPTFKYGDDDAAVAKIYDDYASKIAALSCERIFFSFKKTFDKQRRYYLVLCPGKENAVNYNYLRDIALPRITRLLLVKLYDETARKYYIYVKPVIWPVGVSMTSESAPYRVDLVPDSHKAKFARKSRDGQVEYRNAILQRYPACVVTQVTDPDLLIACHIKDHACCKSEEERYSEYNGFAMTPTIHHLFDVGYLTFDDNGKMLLSDFFRNMDRHRLGLNRTVRVSLHEKSLPYLRWHNKHVFRSLDKSILDSLRSA